VDVCHGVADSDRGVSKEVHLVAVEIETGYRGRGEINCVREREEILCVAH